MSHKQGKNDSLELHKFIEWSNPSGIELPIYPYAYEESMRYGPVYYAEKDCPHMIVVFMNSGSLNYTCENNPEIRLEAGEILIIPLEADYSFRTTEELHYNKRVLEIRGTVLSSICTALHLDTPIKLEAAKAAGPGRKMCRFENILLDKSPEKFTHAPGMTYEFLVALASLIDASGNTRDMVLYKAKIRLEKEFSIPLNMSDLAAELGICKSLLNRIFREEINLSPLQYHIQAKMREARRLLSDTNLPVKGVAHRLGYSNQLYFSNAFKKNCHMSPLEYRKSHADK